MRTLITYFKVFPKRSFYVLIAFLAAGVAEALSLTAILPLLSTAVGENVNSPVGKFVVEILDEVGLNPTIGTMLAIILFGIVCKNLMLLAANRQIGYTVAYIATALRLEYLEAMLASSWQYYLRQPVGSIANSIATEAKRAANGFEQAAAVLSLAIQVSIYIIIAMFVSWEVASISLLAGIIFLSAMYQIIRVTRKAGSKQTILLKSLLTYLADVLGSVKSLKAMARDKDADFVLRSQTKQLEKVARREVISKEGVKVCTRTFISRFYDRRSVCNFSNMGASSSGSNSDGHIVCSDTFSIE